MRARSRILLAYISLFCIGDIPGRTPFEHFHNMAKYFRYLPAGREIDIPASV